MELYPLFVTKLALPLVSRLTDVTIWNDYRQMLHHERLSAANLRQAQLAKLRDLLHHAQQTVPFYRQRFAEVGFDPGTLRDTAELAALPPTTKEDIMAHFPEEITATGMDRSKWKYVATSGTTRQIMGIHDFRKANRNWAAGLRAHKLAGDHNVGQRWMEIPPHMCTTICGINDGGATQPFFHPKLWPLLKQRDFTGIGQHFYRCAYDRRHSLYKRVTLPSFGIEGTNVPEEDILTYLDAIRNYRPYLLEGLPLYLYTFARYLLRKGIAPPPVGVIKPFGGSLTPLMKETIGQGFNCPVFDTYGCSETGFIACDCAKHDGLHLFMDLYHVEVCRNGTPVAPGELGRLYITDLENRAMPWIRYDIGDMGRYFVDDHGCGRHSLRLQVEGRVQDTLVNAAGELFTSDRVFDFFMGIPEIDNFQLIEKSRGSFDLLCVPVAGVQLDKEPLVRRFKEFFDPEAAIRVYPVKSIKAEDGGKFRFIKSKSFPDI